MSSEPTAVATVDTASSHPPDSDVTKHNEDRPKDLTVVHAAYESRDVEASKAEHERRHPDHEPHMGGASEYVKAIVFGGLDGILTAFAIVTAAAGGNQDWKTVLIFGFPNVIADAFSMGFGEYVSGSAEYDLAMQERAREEWEVENNIEGEQREMIDIYQQKGFSEADAKGIVDIISKDKKLFVDIMMVEELGIMIDEDPYVSLKQGAVMFLSFFVFGLFPLFAYLGGVGKGADYIFGISCGCTGFGLLLLGAAKGHLTGLSVPKTAVIMFLQGCVSGGVSFAVGILVNYIITGKPF